MKLTTSEIIRAWKDPVYRASLDASMQADLPVHPAGEIALSDEELGQVVGGRRFGGCGSHHSCPSSNHRTVSGSDCCATGLAGYCFAPKSI